MEVQSIANRLKIAMDKNGMQQRVLCKLTGLDKSLISNYLSGNYQPRQDKVYLMAKALNVSPAWLMGFDVPMNEEEKEELTPPQAKIKIEEIINMTSDLSDQEKMLLRGTLELICKDKGDK